MVPAPMPSVLAGAAPCTARARHWGALMRHRHQLLGCWVLVGGLGIGMAAVGQEDALTGKFYRIIDGKVDAWTYSGFQRYHAVCNQGHGQDGMGSSAPPWWTRCPISMRSGVSFALAQAADRPS
jgi:hypothetical protein